MKLFICYSRDDKPIVEEIVNFLKLAEFDPWFDGLLKVGQDWEKELYNQIDKCDTFIYMLSPESVSSEWCTWEYSKAIELSKPILPVLLRRNTSIPKNLHRYQYADFSKGINVTEFAKFIGGLNSKNQFVLPAKPAPIHAMPSGIPPQVTDIDISTLSENSFDNNQSIEPQPPLITSKNKPNLVDNDKVLQKLKEFLPNPFDWCFIPHGTITKPAVTSTGRKKNGIRTIEIKEFYISKYPITNSQFQLFLKDENGYKNPGLWDFSPDAESWRYNHSKYTATGYRGDKIPRTNVCWYTALAFCRWLSTQVDLDIRLPTLNQWQFAAQGKDQRKFPWGNEFYETRCNLQKNESNIYPYGMRRSFNFNETDKNNPKPTYVDKYANGVSPFGVYDMIGNVWEWCYEKEEEKASIKGGSFKSTHHHINCEVHQTLWAETENDDVGFRICIDLNTD